MLLKFDLDRYVDMKSLEGDTTMQMLESCMKKQIAERTHRILYVEALNSVINRGTSTWFHESRGMGR